MSYQSPVVEILNDILLASSQARQFVAGQSYDDFTCDSKTQYAVVRALEIIGEATKRLPMTFREENPKVPWRDMAAMRDKLIHGYSVVNYAVVWKTVQEDLPIIDRAILQILAEQ